MIVMYMYCRETHATCQMPSTSKEEAVSSSCSGFPPEGYQSTSVNAQLTVWCPFVFEYTVIVMMIMAMIMCL